MKEELVDGGDYSDAGDTLPASNREYIGVNSVFNSDGFRPTLILDEETEIKKVRRRGKVFTASDGPVFDTYGNSVYIPEGFRIAADSANEVTGGVVIEDADATNHPDTVGSQFVWIPVGKVYTDKDRTEANAKTINLGRYSFESDGTPSTFSGGRYSEDTPGGHNSNYENAIAKNIEAFRTNTNSKKGFYIGRYEARVENWTGELIADDYNSEKNWTGYTNGKLVEKGSSQVFNYITQNKASELSRAMYTSNHFESDLINSYAWDTATLFLQQFDNRTYTEADNPNYREKYSKQIRLNDSFAYTGTNMLVGKGSIDKICNVYDMAGNCIEWSTETYSSPNYPCVYRGGYYSSSGYNVSYRDSWKKSYARNYISFRPILYFK